jgi:hypothetical protein
MPMLGTAAAAAAAAATGAAQPTAGSWGLSTRTAVSFKDPIEIPNAL